MGCSKLEEQLTKVVVAETRVEEEASAKSQGDVVTEADTMVEEAEAATKVDEIKIETNEGRMVVVNVVPTRMRKRLY